MRRPFLLVIVFLFATTVCLSQNKAVIVQNSWDNDLNDYHPKEFLSEIENLFKEKLRVRELVQDFKAFKIGKAEDNWDKKLQEQLKARKNSGDTAYYIAVSSDLKLPTMNLGKLFFKNPPRSSKLIFIFHVYDAAGNEIIGDTIVNRGCLMKAIEKGQSNKFFYSDYESFLSDMGCHLAIIKKRVLAKLLPPTFKAPVENKTI
jgi:hypothetical protein